MFSGVFTAEEVDGVGNKGSGNTTTVEGQTTVEANMSLKYACLTDDALSGQKRTSSLGTILKCWIIKISRHQMLH